MKPYNHTNHSVGKALCALLFALLPPSACTNHLPAEEKTPNDYEIAEWPESDSTIHVKPNESHPTTHEDSVRFGLL